ncbi:MAG: hypothetical protein HYZ42_15725 [Bacteroidetes bacterium]|nr:hypothetical protein [Bacteroidota bacterium]
MADKAYITPAKKSHLNYVVLDSDWEEICAKTLEEIETLDCSVKNQFLGFDNSYANDGKDQQYFTDSIARVKSNDKAEKKWFVEDCWIPALNASINKYEYSKWHFIEIANEIRNIMNQFKEKIQSV